MICVGMECGHGDGERLSEYMPFHPYRGAFSKYEARGDLTMQWIIGTVLRRALPNKCPFDMIRDS
ncbi:MAG: hypothetical protein IJT77_01075 [Clostridia bacterium]|nr:hypothetical protein [Clostridia bacterium]